MFDEPPENKLTQAEHDADLAYQEIADLNHQLSLATRRLEIAEAAIQNAEIYCREVASQTDDIKSLQKWLSLAVKEMEDINVS